MIEEIKSAIILKENNAYDDGLIICRSDLSQSYYSRVVWLYFMQKNISLKGASLTIINVAIDLITEYANDRTKAQGKHFFFGVKNDLINQLLNNRDLITEETLIIQVPDDIYKWVSANNESQTALVLAGLKLLIDKD